MAGMNENDFNNLERIVDRLLDSELSEKQLADVNSIIRISYKHIHKSNDLVERTTIKMDEMNVGMATLQLLLTTADATKH